MLRLSIPQFLLAGLSGNLGRHGASQFFRSFEGLYHLLLLGIAGNVVTHIDRVGGPAYELFTEGEHWREFRWQ